MTRSPMVGLAVTLALLGSACHDEAPLVGPTGVTFLDPVAEEAAILKDVVIESWTFGQDPKNQGPWSYKGPPPLKGKQGGVRLLGYAERPPQFTLSFPKGVSEPFDVVSLSIDYAGACTSRLALDFDDGTQATIELVVPFRTEQEPLRYYIGGTLASMPNKKLRRLTIQPSVDVARPMEVMGASLVRRGIADRSNDPVGHDQGLVQLGGLRRRVWTAPMGRALVVTTKVEGQPQLDVTLWPSDGTRRTRRVLWGKVVATPKGSSIAPTTIAEGELPLADLAEGSLHLVGDLSGFEGQEVELRFTSGLVTETPSEPQSGTVTGLWESPSLVRQRDLRTRPNVVLVTLDTTRADFAAEPELAPHLAKLAGEGLNFTNAWSPCNTTSPAHASIFTGLLPHSHGTLAVGKYPLRSEVLSMAEIFRSNGYATAATTSVEHIDVAHGFGQGFDIFLDGTLEGSLDGRVALQAAKGFIGDATARHKEPFFLWVHWFDVHAPYERPKELPPDFIEPTQTPAPKIQVLIPDWARKQTGLRWFPKDQGLPELVADYSGGIAYVDWLLGQLVDQLEASGLMDNTIIAITADHGEGLGEKGIFASHISLYRPVLRVPLVLHLPFDEVLPDSALNAPVSSLDLLPTLIEVARLQVPDGFVESLAGKSLLQPDLSRVLWFESDRLLQIGRLEDGQMAISTLRKTVLSNTKEVRVINPGTRELYDYNKDPLMLHDEIQEGTAPSQAAAWFEESKHKIPLGEDDDLMRILSPKETERLRALGYLGD